jgi:acetyltransferase EpsM
MTSATHIWLIGGGGHAKVVADAAELTGRTIGGVFDDAESPALGAQGVPRLGSVQDVADALRDSDALAHLALGNLRLRRRVLDWLAAQGVGPERFATIIHPSAVVSGTVRIGRGAFIAPGAIINADATIGDHAIINTGAVVEHDAKLAENCHIAPAVTLCGGVQIGRDALIGAGAIVTPGVGVGAGATAGAGAVVLRDLPEGVTAVGCPARPMASPPTN